MQNANNARETKEKKKEKMSRKMMGQKTEEENREC